MRLQRFTMVTGALLLILLAGALPATAKVKLFSAVVEYNTLESEHFRLHYPKEYEVVAREILTMAEDIHDNLQPILNWVPESKVDLVLQDNGDDANGFSQVYPYNRIVLYTAPPESRMQLDDYDDWMRILVAHEYTHTLHLDNKSGLPAIINMIFGKIFNPNLTNPHWISEGFAIASESRETLGGRNRSSLYDMFMRMDVLGGNFQTLDQISGTPTTWPQASIYYLYGAFFTRYIADRFGDDIFGSIAYLYGRQVIPYGLNAIMEEVSGYDYVELYEDWQNYIFEQYREQQELIERYPVTEGDVLTETGGVYNWLQMMPDGRHAVFYRNRGHKRSGWYRMDIETGEESLIKRMNSCAGGSLSLDGREIIVSAPTIRLGRFYHHDLFSLDIASGSLTRLTHDKRSTMPALGPHNRFIAYVAYGFMNTELVIYDRYRGTYRTPLSRKQFDQVLDPAYSPDGKHIAFVGTKRGGYKDLYLLDVETNAVTRLTNNRALEVNPRYSRDGQYLYYTTDLTGVYNVVRRHVLSGAVERLTNVIGGAFSAAPIPEDRGLMFVGYSHTGYDIHRYMYPPDFQPIPAPSLDFRGYHLIPTPQQVEILGPRRYSPFPSLYPHIWLPSSGQDYAGNTIGIRIEGTDATSSHSWSMEVDYGIESRDVTFAGGYFNSVYPLRFNMSFSHSSQTLDKGAVKDGKNVDFHETFYNAAIGTSYSFGGLTPEYSQNISLSYNFSYTRGINNYSFDPAEGELKLPETGMNAGISIGWSYGDREYQPDSIGSAFGRGLSFSASFRHRSLGSQYNSIILSAGASYYVRIPFTETHTIAARINGGFATGDYNYRRFFYLGGPPPINLVSNLLYNERQFGVYLRGYPSYAIGGDRFVMLKSEYRFSLWEINRGIYTLPLFFQKLHGAVFFDAANAWETGFEVGDTVKAVGAELRLDMVLGYYAYATLRFGYARGLDDKGENQVFLLLDNIF